MPRADAIPQFPRTRWSVVLAAAGQGTQARLALEELCRLYWFPLYAFARQRGCTPEDAEDETQEFLARVAGGGLLSAAEPGRGHLRTYLLAMFQRDLIDSRRRASRHKRGGEAVTLPLDVVMAEDRLAGTLGASPPDGLFDRAWALTCLETAADLLAAEYESRGRGSLFQSLRPFLDPASEADYAATQIQGLNGNALRQAVFRLRQRFRVLLRQTIADTLEQPTEALIDQEMAALRAAMTG